MKHIKRFNEEMTPQTYNSAADKLTSMGQEERADRLRDWADENEDLPKSEQPLFSMEQLEGAFLSARVVDQEGEPRFKDFRDWYMSELGSSVDMRDYAFNKHTKSPFNQYQYFNK